MRGSDNRVVLFTAGSFGLFTLFHFLSMNPGKKVKLCMKPLLSFNNSQLYSQPTQPTGIVRDGRNVPSREQLPVVKAEFRTGETDEGD